MNYVNPASFMPNADFTKNPLQGYFAGEAEGQMQQLLDRTYRDSDLSYLDQLHQYDMSKAKDPAVLSDIAATTAENQNRSAIAQDPLSRQAPLSNLKTQVDTNDTKQVMNEQTREGARNGLVVQMNEEFAKSPLTPEDFVKDPAAANARWSEWQQKFQKVGINLPPQPTPDFLATLPAKANAAKMNLDYQRKLGEISAQGSNQANVANIAGGYGVQRANIAAATSRENNQATNATRANIAADALKDDASMRRVLEQAASSGDVRTARMFADEMATRQGRLAAAQDIRMIQAQAAKDPQAIESIYNEYINRYKQQYEGIIQQAAAGKSPVDKRVDQALSGSQQAAPKPKAFPDEAVNMLKKNPTPEMKAYFDKTFGAGAANQALK